jgi:hypothetical protein
MGFPALPLLSAAAELFVVNLVAQHNPQADTQFARRRLRRFDPSINRGLATNTSCPHSVITSCTQAE